MEKNVQDGRSLLRATRRKVEYSDSQIQMEDAEVSRCKGLSSGLGGQLGCFTVSSDHNGKNVRIGIGSSE